MEKRKRTEILETPAGPRLNILVEQAVFARKPCVCFEGPHTLDDAGCCTECLGLQTAWWSESCKAMTALRAHVNTWDYQRRMKFLDNLGAAIAYRMDCGKIEPRQWIMHVTPADFARAAVLTALDGV